MKIDEIVSNLESPMLIRAGPGSGKTTLLAERIKFLLDKNEDKNTITVLSYNKDTRQHLYNKLVDKEGKFQINSEDLPQISTLHSLGYQIVKDCPEEVNLNNNLEVQDDEDVTQLIFRDAALILGLTEEDSRVARKCKQYGDCRENAKEKKCRICGRYREIMSKCNRIDFDDQILFALQILEKKADIREKYQSKAKHLLVDEYQDINSAQFKLIELLSRESRKGLFVVGDDAQTIYAFRGCNPKFILHFDEDFPNAKIPPLPYSHRCHEKTMNDACKVLKKYYKEWKQSQLEFDTKEGEEPAIWQWLDEKEEALWTARAAQKFMHEKKTVLILAPKKEFFSLISTELSKLNVPYACQENVLSKQINDRMDILLQFMKWVTNPSDTFITRLVIEDLLNFGIAKVPGAKKNRRCNPETIEKRISEEREIAKLWELVDRNNDLFSVLMKLKTENMTLKKIQEGLGRLLNLYNQSSDNNPGDFVKELYVITGIWKGPSIFVADMYSVIKLVQFQRPLGISIVQLMTMRKAKGLDADIVIIVGLENDIMPNPISDKIEEARLFYVSMTRAKEKVILFHSWKRPRNISFGKDVVKKKRSCFLDDIGRKSKYPKRK